MQHEEYPNYSGQKWHAETGIFSCYFKYEMYLGQICPDISQGKKTGQYLKKEKRGRKEINIGVSARELPTS